MTERTKVFIARKDGTPENGCSCEGCVFLRTPIGEAMMKWSIKFANECKSAVELGLKTGTELHINMNGPSAKSLVRNDPFNKGEKYIQFSFDPAKVLEEDVGVILKGPNTEVLMAEYGNDPVLRSVIDWLAKRYGS